MDGPPQMYGPPPMYAAPVMHGPPSGPPPWQMFLRERVLIFVGAILLIICPYLPWLHVVILGDFNLTGLLAAAHYSQAIAYIVTGVGVAVLLVTVLAKSVRLIAAIAITVGIVFALLGGDTTYGMIRAVSASAGLGQMGVGPILGVLGAVFLIVPAIVVFARSAGWRAESIPLWRAPQWIPLIIGLIITAGLVFLPYHAGVGNYCGTPVGASFKAKDSLPSETPPASVSSQLSADQQALTAAKNQLNGDESGAGSAQEEQNNADALSNKADQAESNATNLQQTVYSDQNTVDTDQSTVEDDQSTIDGDQSALSGDQSALQTDEQALSQDSADGLDTSFDTETINQDKQQVASDQATLNRDKQQLTADQAALGKANQQLATDNAALNSANNSANSLSNQSQAAENNAANDQEQAQNTVSEDQQNVSDAQSQLNDDEQSWQNSHQSELEAATTYNHNLDACVSQARSRYIAAGIATVLGGLITILLLWRRDQPYGPDSGPSPQDFSPA